MFRFIFFNRLKCTLRNRQAVFWSALFPVLLATFFGMAFCNLDKDTVFTKIPIAVVNGVQYQQNTDFQSALRAVSTGAAKAEDQLFTVSTVPNCQQADEKLKSGTVKGYIWFDSNVHVVVKGTGTDETILKQFVDTTLQTQAAVTNAVTAAPRSAQNITTAVGQQKSFLQKISLAKGTPKESLTYFYALIAMACLYGSFGGAAEVSYTQANLSAQGMRVNFAPVHKLKVFGASLCAATFVQFCSVLVLLLYMRFILSVQMDADLPYILLGSFAGSLAGVALGALVGAVVRAAMGVKIGVLVAVSNVLCFFSGLMYDKMKYLLTQAFPPAAYLNPANLIADAFYALSCYTDHSRYFLNISLLFVFSLLCYCAVYLVMRRKKYESV